VGEPTGVVGVGGGRHDHDDVVTLRAQSRLPADVGAELLDLLADGPEVLACDLSGMAAAGLPAVAQAFVPAGDYLRHWRGTALVLYATEPAVRSALGAAVLGDRVLVTDDLEHGVAQAWSWLPHVARTGVQLPPWPESAAEGRRLVRHSLEEWRLTRLREPADLVVTELVTNAIVHAKTVLHLTLVLAGDQLRVAVRDRGGSRASVDALVAQQRTLHGRGLRTIEAYTCGWGVLPARYTGKTVWAILDTTVGHG
jgi:hypothetical protein